jgi:hypothetical protein
MELIEIFFVVSFLLIHYKPKVKVDLMVMNDYQILFVNVYFLMVESEEMMDQYVIEINQMHDLYLLKFRVQEE